MPNNAGIEAIIELLEQKIKVTKDANPRKEALVLILQTMLPAKNDWDMACFAKALDQLNRIPVLVADNFFSKPHVKMLGFLVAQQTRQLVTEKCLNADNALAIPPVSNKDTSFFIHLYQQIEKLHEQSKLWIYHYPSDADNIGITNEAIQLWQDLLKQPSDRKDNAYDDFKRDFTIQELQAKTASEVTTNLNQMLAQTHYNDAQKKLLFDWLAMNGGQDMNRVIDNLCRAGEFTAGKEYDILTSQLLSANWSIENDTPTVNIAIQYFTLLNVESRQILMLPLGKQATHDDDVAAHTLELKKELAPLMQVNIKIALTIPKDVVEPKITELKITSYTRQLTSPDPALKKASPSIL